MDAIEHLQRLGFGEYESKAYVALLQRGALNGYELAKAAGLPRPNIYGVLQKLEERGAVLRADTPVGPRYSALPATELLQRLDTRFQDALAEAGASLATVGHVPEIDYAWNVGGYSQALEHAKALLGSAREQALVAIRPTEAQALSTTLHEAQVQGAKFTTLCLQGCPEECGHCRGRVHRYPVETDEKTRWLVIVADGLEMLAAEIGPNERTWAVRSRQRLLVEMASWYVRQTISQGAVLSDLRGKEEEALSAETLALLRAQEARGSGLKFTGYIRRLLDRKGR